MTLLRASPRRFISRSKEAIAWLNMADLLKYLPTRFLMALWVTRVRTWKPWQKLSSLVVDENWKKKWLRIKAQCQAEHETYLADWLEVWLLVTETGCTLVSGLMLRHGMHLISPVIPRSENQFTLNLQFSQLHVWVSLELRKISMVQRGGSTWMQIRVISNSHARHYNKNCITQTSW